MKFIIVGLGSIGKKHKANLESLGHIVVDSYEMADGALVCNPTSLHLKTALEALKYKIPVLIEKPISHNLEGLNQLQGKVLVGYCLRFDQSLNEFKQKICKEDVKSVKIVCQSWLPDWQPNSDYRQSYSAKTALGGGVLLDLSHEIDYALWFFGPVKSVSAKLQLSPELKIETEAIADLNIEFISGIKAEIHLSYASHQPARFCEVKTKNQVFRWDFKPNNEMYIEEIKHFIKIVQGKELPRVTVDDGINVLKVIKTAKINQV